MLKKIINSSLAATLVGSSLFLAAPTLALESVSASELASAEADAHEFSVGVGTEYGLLIGAQYAYRTEGKRYKVGVGAVGLSFGAEAKFAQSDSFSYGVTAGYIPAIFSDGGAIYVGPTWHYYLGGFADSGVVFSTGLVGYHSEEGTDDESRQNWFNRERSNEQGVVALFSLGYKF